MTSRHMRIPGQTLIDDERERLTWHSSHPARQREEARRRKASIQTLPCDDRNRTRERGR